MRKRTKSADDLRLELELALETTGEEGDVALAVVAGVGDVPDHVEHGAARAGQDGHEREELPQPAVLDDGPDVRPERHERRADAGNGRDGEEYGEPVRGPVDFGDGAAWQVAAEPVPDRFRGGGAGVSCKYWGGYIYIYQEVYSPRGEVKSHGVGVGNSEFASRGLEEQEDRGGLQSELVVDNRLEKSKSEGDFRKGTKIVYIQT